MQDDISVSESYNGGCITSSTETLEFQEAEVSVSLLDIINDADFRDYIGFTIPKWSRYVQWTLRLFRAMKDEHPCLSYFLEVNPLKVQDYSLQLTFEIEFRVESHRPLTGVATAAAPARMSEESDDESGGHMTTDVVVVARNSSSSSGQECSSEKPMLHSVLLKQHRHENKTFIRSADQNQTTWGIKHFIALQRILEGQEVESGLSSVAASSKLFYFWLIPGVFWLCLFSCNCFS